ncbi:hypothetical protein VF21_05233 [Pseudogymnoascus sp. 05NY08]|nr:hypothetical protein VF21_05233 [Pseudogymnoascus sp. 05NY08]
MINIRAPCAHPLLRSLKRLLIPSHGRSTRAPGPYPYSRRAIPTREFTAISGRHLANSKKQQDELFSYTSGRYLYNEKQRLAERYVEFNIEELKAVAAESVGRKRVSHMKKLAEGGFNRVFLLTMDDGFEAIVKIPYHLTVPKHFTTESEVATLDFLQSKGIPVPRVYTWSSKSGNAVGAEYIIMEKAPGQPLEDRWFSLSPKERVRIVTSYVELEMKLFSLPIDAFGSLYYKENLPPHLQAEIYASDTPDESGDAKRFCVGPTADYMFWRGKRAGLELDRGPWRDPHAYLRAIGTKELEYTRRFGKPMRNKFPHNDMLEGEIAPEAYTELLDKYLALSSYLLPKSREHLLNRPILRHPDLNPMNIFVSDECEVSCIIDWQHTTVLPLLLAAGNPPLFENPDPTPPKDYAAPTLPENYATLNPDEKEYADELHRRRMLFYLYMIFNGKDNKDHFSAMRTPLLAQRQHLMERAGMQWTGNTVTLQGALMRVVDGWGLLALEGHWKVECPVSFGAEESEAFYELEENWFKGNIIVEHWKEQEVVEKNRALKKEWYEMSEDDADRALVEGFWPFDDREEIEWDSTSVESGC